MQRERRRAGRAIRKARREQREAFAAVSEIDLTAMFAEIRAAVESVAAAFADVVRVIVMDFENASAGLMAYYRLAKFESEQQSFRDRLAFRALEPVRAHAEGLEVAEPRVICGMPPGLSYNPRTGYLSGTPTASGVYHFTAPRSPHEDTTDAKGSGAT